MTIRIQFNDAAFTQQLARATADGLKRAAAFLTAQCKIAVSKANPHHHVAQLKPHQRRGQKKAKVWENMHNRYAGQPPFARTGHGRSNIVWEFNDDPLMPAVRVGVRKNGIYMAYLELGTGRVRSRPWLLVTFEKHRPTIVRLILSGGGR
jgi:hypothetical protein